MTTKKMKKLLIVLTFIFLWIGKKLLVSLYIQIAVLFYQLRITEGEKLRSLRLNVNQLLKLSWIKICGYS